MITDYISMNVSRGVMRGGTIPRALNHNGGAKKSQQCHNSQVLSSIQHSCFQKTLGSNIGVQNLLL